MFPDEVGQSLLGALVRRELRADVGAALAGVANVGEEERQHVVVGLAAGDESDRRESEPLLIDFARAGGHAAGRHPAHVGVVRPRDGVAEHLAVDRERRDHRHVGQVRPALEGVVEDEHVARFRVVVEDRVNGLGHRAEVDRDVFGLRDEAAVGVEQRRRAVAALLDVRRVRRGDEHLSHLLGDALELVAHDFERHGVDLGVAHSPSPPLVRTSVPSAPTVPPHAGGTTTVLSCCSRMAGPSTVVPAPRPSRS